MTKEYYCNQRFNQVKDLFEWKVVPNFSKYSINAYGDVYNHVSGQCMHSNTLAPAKAIYAMRDDGVPSYITIRKLVRELFGIGYQRQKDMRSQKNAIFTLASEIKKSV